MERIYALIDKLYQQKQGAASTAHLLFTVQLLQQELAQLQNKPGAANTPRVSVTMPGYVTFSDKLHREPSAEAVKAADRQDEKEIFVLEAVAEEDEQPEEVLLPAVEAKEYILRQPPLADAAYLPKPAVMKEEAMPAYSSEQLFSNAFETTAEAPTLTQYAVRKEVNHAMADRQESLNDRLKEERPEVAHRLKEAPIKDLRKAIGINDRFVFVKELFRGDEAAYERSLKTINGFNIYSEAEYWMARELRLKLAWSDTNETVQHFYSLVRRRFA